MKKLFFFSFFFFQSLFGSAQVEQQIWSEVAVKNKISENWTYSVSLNNRTSRNGVESFFGQFNLKYTKYKWVKPSVDYRCIADHTDYINYQLSNRLNFNMEFKKKLKRLDSSVRLRYQTTLRGSAVLNDLEFDNTFRIKSEFAYDVRKTKINPFVSGEWFYDPTNWEYGKQFSKFRGSAGINYPLSSKILGSLGYMYDVRIRQPERQFKHIVTLSITYNLEK